MADNDTQSARYKRAKLASAASAASLLIAGNTAAQTAPSSAPSYVSTPSPPSAVQQAWRVDLAKVPLNLRGADPHTPKDYDLQIPVSARGSDFSRLHEPSVNVGPTTIGVSRDGATVGMRDSHVRVVAKPNRVAFKFDISF